MICPAFQADSDVCRFPQATSLAYGYENQAFQATRKVLLSKTEVK